jgi:hypothetical protein
LTSFTLTPPSYAHTPEGEVAWNVHEEKIRELVRDGDVETAVEWAGSTHGAELLSQIWSGLEPSILGPALAHVWMRSHAPLKQLGSRTWVSMFKSAGFVSDGPSQPTEALQVYRAARVWTNGHGLAWTLTADVALIFYRRWREAGFHAGLYRATVRPAAVLARFDGRQEREAVVNPNMLRGRIEVLETGGPMSGDESSDDH